MAHNVVRINAGPAGWTLARKPLGIFFGAMAVAVSGLPVGNYGQPITLALLLAGVVTLLSRPISWTSMLTTLIGLIFFIPIKRYTLPGSLPFNLEPYRIYVALMIVAWLVALMVDPRVRLRGSRFDLPIIGVMLTAVFSLAANPGRLGTSGVSVEAIKSLTFFLSFVLVFYFVVSVVHTPELVERIVKLIVGCGAVVAVLALIEYRTNFNLFNHLGSLPGLTYHDPKLDISSYARGGRLRVYGSAQHPIALAALLSMLLPLGAYLAFRYRSRWWTAAAAVTALGAATTVSRTGILMVCIELVVLFVLKPFEVRKILKYLPLALIVVAILAPNSIKGVYDSFFPKGGLISQQSQLVANNPNAQPRLADVGPSLRQFTHHPFLGIGFGTRVLPSDTILDDQWLGSLLEVGALGVFALLALFFRSVRLLGSAARKDDGPRGLLYAACAASITAFGFGMATFDTFSFIQVTYFFFLLLALGAVLLGLEGEDSSAPARLARARDDTT